MTRGLLPLQGDARPPPQPEGDDAWRQVRDQQGQRRQVPVHLKAPDGEIIAASQGYATKAAAEKGIEAIMTHAISAKVEDHSGG